MNTAKIDLHLHLDGSLNIGWAYKKALQRDVISKDTSFEDFYNLLFPQSKGFSYDSFKKFDLTCNLLQTYEDLFEATYDLCKRDYEMGLIYIEIRFASQNHILKGLSQYDALKAVIDGANKAMEDFDIKVGIINCMMHKGDNEAYNHALNIETIEVSKKFYKKGLVAMDLAGYENNCDFKEYGPLFEIIDSYGMPYTIHAGEMGIGEHVMDAINMKAKRIGHGINCIQDQRYIDAIKENNIPLEICVTCNIGRTLNYASHPIRRLMKEGIKITVNSDNMMFARTDLVNEHHQLKMLGLTDEDLRQFSLNALDVAFCDDETKQYLKTKI